MYTHVCIDKHTYICIYDILHVYNIHLYDIYICVFVLHLFIYYLQILYLYVRLYIIYMKYVYIFVCVRVCKGAQACIHV